MGWQIQTHDLHSVRSFKEAEAHWNGQKPWKSEYEDRRALAGWRKVHMFLRKLSGGGYECVLYSTAIVTFYPGGEVKLSCHDSASSKAFAWHMAPLHCAPVSHQSNMYWKVETPDGPHYQRSSMVIAPADEANLPYWIVTNPGDPEKEWVLDKTKAAEVRKILQPYQKWYTMTSRLMNNSSIHGYSTYATELAIEQLLKEPNNIGAYPEYMGMLGAPEHFRHKAYEIAGARTKHPVPYNRLPRN